MSDMRDAYLRDPVAANAMIVEQYRATGGQLPPPLHGSRILLLTTRGAKTGEDRTSPLGFVTDGGMHRMVLYASNIGADRDPGWCRNLRANPDVVVEVGAERFDARATVLDGGPERDRLFELFTGQMPGTAAHQDRTGRTIPMVLVEQTG
jgi:deazaflavin-dependent oxidoreductase (nitroreductase family)